MDFDKLTGVLAKLLKVSSEELLSGFRPARLSEIASVSRLREPNADEEFHQRDVSYLRWRYFDRTPGVVDLWVLERNSDILASIGLERMQFLVGKESQQFVKIIDLIVRKDLQTLGVAPWMCLGIKHRFDRVMVIGSNDNSIGLTKKLWPAITIMQKFIHPLNFTRWIAARHPGNPAWRLISYPGQWLLQGFRILRLKYLSSRYELRHFDSIDALHKLVEKSANSKSLTLRQTRRDQDYFAWRFKHHPRLEFRASGVVNREGQLLAYLICTLEETQLNDSGLKVQRCYAMDWRFINSAEPKLLSCLLLDQMRHYSALGAESFSALATDSCSRRALKGAGFLSLKEDPRFFVYDKNEDLSSTDQDDWRITYADTDQLDHEEIYFG